MNGLSFLNSDIQMYFNSNKSLWRSSVCLLCILYAFLVTIGGCSWCPPRSFDNKICIAVFNTSLTRPEAGRLYKDLKKGDQQARAIAQIIQTVRPDILLLNEFDYDSGCEAAEIFIHNYLVVSQSGLEPILYPYKYTAPVNTGIPSGFDLDNDGSVAGPGDCFGYGQFPGQYGMLVLSRYPIKKDNVRTFQKFLWKDIPAAMLPDDPATPDELDWYSPQELEIVRLSSKSHWDVPVSIGGLTLHLLVSHPTPPVFDGPEDRNGLRNHDEIRFWADYINPETSGYIYDDAARKGGLDSNAFYVIMGDLNADPHDGDSTQNAVNQLLMHPDIQDTKPVSKGAVQASQNQQGANSNHLSPSEFDTYQSSPPGRTPGNLRLDFVLPSGNITVIDSGVFWPLAEDARAECIKFSDHRMVYVDIQLNGSR